MSDSRLEKFIYAICSMDVSDLPVPLSRIEKLWNCLITGETPDFEPLSRNEKYLMAMLDRYDISNLPTPMSRGEKLLYKIAVGETDLSDVPGYLSRYEELLKYLIENGGISGGDFEYVLHTLNQSLSTLYLTAEKPVKSAILSGNTLVNLMTKCKDEYVVRYNDIDNPNNTVANISMMKPNTEYTLFYKAKYRTEGDGAGTLGGLKVATSIEQGFFGTGQKYTTEYMKYVYKFTTSSVVDCFVFSSNGSYFAIKECVLLEGDYTQEDVPYFTGMQSVKMPVLTTTGKNLFDGELEDGAYDYLTGNPVDANGEKRSKYPIRVNGNAKYYFSSDSVTENVRYYMYDENMNFIATDIFFAKDGVITTVADTAYVHFRIVESDNVNIQIEHGAQVTSYEPFKSNILTVNEDVTLRGIGDVQDKLDCLTGEVTESIGEIVLDGTQYMDADGRGIYIQVDDMKKVEDYRTIITCDKLPVFHHQWDLPNVENGIAGYLDEENKYPGQNWLYIKVNNSIDVGEVRQILTQNPITAQYGLSVESIKTVDLTVVDQDNQPTQLGTFENVTHVSLEAENLIPEVEMEVATHISEELASASPLMDDISTKQEQLSTTIDEQSENVDATMIATTEIYEETL